ncbi:MAG TPA: malonyl-CoA decarboxylase family protein [Casimicrobiaceae bacterium]
MVWNWLGHNGVARWRASRASFNGARVRRTLADCAKGVGGEASARRRVAELAALYRALSDESRRAFLALLAQAGIGDDPDPALFDAFRQVSGVERRLAAIRLRAALAGASLRVLKQFNLLDDGVKFLVDLRADAMRLGPGERALAVVDEELLGLFGDWFALGNLELRRISWQSPAALLEKLMSYEAVHEIRSWTDLRHRLDSDRRCYAFFHPRMADEPLVFVEVALTRRVASSIQSLLDESTPAADPRSATAAVFYSISSTQAGLRGVAFGGFLIKRVVEKLLGEFPRLGTFATLSPVPGFRRWLERQLDDAANSLLCDRDRIALERLTGNAGAAAAMRAAIAGDFTADRPLGATLEACLTPLCARYLALAKRDGAPIDPVARFHFGNGARLARIDWLADGSARGMRQSLGMMVNYEYEPSRIEANHEAYFRDGKVAVSRSIRRLLRNGETTSKEDLP